MQTIPAERRSSVSRWLGCALAALLGAAGAAGPAFAGDAIRVGTFNIRYANDGDGTNAWPKRRDMVLTILADGDFWGLQEALPTQVAEIARARPEFGMLVRSRDADATHGEACPILYRKDRWTLDESESGTFWLSESPGQAGSKSWDSSLPRICTHARFTDKASGRGLSVFNTHLDHQGPKARLEAIQLIVRRMGARGHADEPVVLLGDFNCGPASEPVQRALADTTLRLRDAWRAANPGKEEQATFNGWRERCEGDRIDWILVGGSLRVQSCGIDATRRDGRWPSDHAFVTAELAWGERNGSPPADKTSAAPAR